MKLHFKLKNLALFVLSLSLSWTVGCSSPQKATHQNDHVKEFVSYLKENPKTIWSSHLPSKARKALQAYQQKKPLFKRNGKTIHYGDSVRNYNPTQKTYAQIEADMKKLQCKKQDDYLKNPKTLKPSLNADGQKIPLIAFLCEDGGVIRVKPLGDPNNSFRKVPHGNKALRYPYTSKFESFEDEQIKVDPEGNPVPKWMKDINTAPWGDQKEHLIEGWANDAHFNLLIE